MYINEFTIDDFQSYLNTQLLDIASPIVAVESAGEGNMNYTYRLLFDDHPSIIIKQAPPFCAKFPTIAAPQQRVGVESVFYELVNADVDVSTYFPSLLNTDNDKHIILLEDLGRATDFVSLYSGEPLSSKDTNHIVSILNGIHKQKPESPIDNMGMRELNHAHIFDIPLQQDNGLDLNDITQGLAQSAQPLITDKKYKQLAYELGQEYLKTGDYLLHGDYYPGSWLKGDSGVAVIDPEFCFTGAVEFDLGNLLAHMVLSGQNGQVIDELLTGYKPQHSVHQDFALMFAGTEIMRRLLGYAQLPIECSLKQKERWLEQSYQLVCNPSVSVLK
ncbi:phosphotransferase [Alteromonas sp. 5E99-2]|uniref:phosphotransferase n=1 Tax=Alteromonas sp. 5E99-2 TaxID=2817683 RepID=UPI001A999853|nr:phosphotransferase [Alteromonas sp. 5E99-2]MBO1254417.1 phosphotransferase [Alteromonas sp. 5E99-2]